MVKFFAIGSDVASPAAFVGESKGGGDLGGADRETECAKAPKFSMPRGETAKGAIASFAAPSRCMCPGRHLLEIGDRPLCTWGRRMPKVLDHTIQ